MENERDVIIAAGKALGLEVDYDQYIVLSKGWIRFKDPNHPDFKNIIIFKNDTKDNYHLTRFAVWLKELGRYELKKELNKLISI